MLGLDIAYLCAKFNHYSWVGAYQNLNGLRNQAPLSGMICHPCASICYDQPTHQIELSNSTHYEDIKVIQNIENRVVWGS